MCGTDYGSIEAYRDVYNEQERIFAAHLQQCGLSDADYWIMYLINEGVDSQKDLCAKLMISKQTVNSACLRFAAKGLIEMKAQDSNLRTKRITVTAKGKDFIERNVVSLLQSEERVWQAMDESDCKELVRIMKIYNNLMKEELRRQ
ncbi:MAG: MarR family winged helix-turn-helix transcriptional regulator [Clostridia bacterium]|nr:MarR family winged helix-turn-helix transcriptional regulator [Clostridia bacterium]